MNTEQPTDSPEDLRAEIAKLARWHQEDGAEMTKMRATITRLRAELATARADALNAGADAIDDMEHRNAWPVRPVVASICSEFLRGMAAGNQTVPEQTEACGKCRTPFAPDDTRFDGHARHASTPYCRRCVDACHEADAFHQCVICR